METWIIAQYCKTEALDSNREQSKVQISFIPKLYEEEIK